EEALPAIEAAAIEHIRPDREEGFRKRRGLDEIEPFRNVEALGFRRDAIFRVAAARHQRAQLVAFLVTGDAGAPRDNRARDFEPRNVRCAGRRCIAAHALQDVRAVDPGRGNLDQHFIMARLRHRARRRHQHFRSAELLDFNRGHRFWHACHAILQACGLSHVSSYNATFRTSLRILSQRMHSILRNATMTSDDDEDRSAQSLRGMNFDSMSIAELEDYITDLDTEIARAKSMIERKRLAQNAAAGFFKS